jgi:hypothetical protein
VIAGVSRSIPIRAAKKINPGRGACILLRMPTMTEFSLSEVIALLTRTPATLDALLRGLPDTWVRSNEGRSKEGKDTWSPFDIVGHVARATPGRIRPPAQGEPGCAASAESTARRLGPAWKASGTGSGYAIGTSGDLGRARPHSSASAIPRNGPPVSRRSRPVERVPGSAALLRSQRVGKQSPYPEPESYGLAFTFVKPLPITSTVSSASFKPGSSSRVNHLTSAASLAAARSPATRRHRKSIKT